ncbi:MAG: universal stress protein UspA-like protein [Myxococcaceae bacterium]|nr:universal stress protein UspA-like protein [Myxococcaceae bacterium]
MRSLQVLGVAFAEIVREVERIDLIVMGTHGRHGVGRLILGSVAEHVMRTAKVPVMVVRIFDDEHAQQDLPAEPASLSPQAVKAFHSILVSVDLRSPSMPAVQYAFEVAERLGATVHLLYAYPDVTSAGGWLGAMPFDSPCQQALDKLDCLALPRRRSAALASCVAACGDPAKVIPDTASTLTRI